MENQNIEIKGNGIRVTVLSTIFIIIGVAAMVASLFTIKKIYDKYDNMKDSFQFSEIEREAALGFKEASDYLTAQARQFAVDGNIENAQNYFEEKDVIKRRENALETIGSSGLLAVETNLLDNAYEQSEGLVQYELHAMKLIAVAKNIDAAKISEEVSSFKLSDEELALSPAEQQNQAIQLLYSKDYAQCKDTINWDVESAITLIKDESGVGYRRAERDLIFVLNIATLLIFIMFVLLMLIFVFNTLLVVRPARKFVGLLDKKEKLPEIGGYEFRTFAKKYNDIYRSNKKNISLLKEQGEVDELTGTLKVGILDAVKRNLTENNKSLGIMMIDIDNFRSIKETNGYDMADKVVVKVADLFTAAFMGSDYIIRTSQDEFEIFLVGMEPGDADLLLDRVSNINNQLKNPADDVISTSVSVGIAFSENGFTVEAERNADKALNNVKENGRGACKIL